ncbi:hypothetical protein JW823_08965 [bacterium]|nr:hypothetical protein [candidate division CSSED10-310 bacterium]
MRQSTGWTLHLITGLALLILLGTHMIIMHLDDVIGVGNINPDKKPVDWENVTARGKQITMMFFYIIFLGCALYHACFGSRTILLETDFGANNKQLITAIVVILGFGLFIFGTAAAIKFVDISQAGMMVMGG